MPEVARETQYAETIKRFTLIIKQYRLYSERHPAAQLALRSFFSVLEEVLSAQAPLTFGFTEGKVIVNEIPFDLKKTGVAELLRETRRLQIESLIFERGISGDEISTLFKLMTVPQKTIEDSGGFKPAFEKESLPRIRLGTSHYRMIKDEEEVIKKPEIRKVERMDQVVEHGFTGTEQEVDFDVERLTYEVEKKPESVARDMVRRADNLESLKRIVTNLAGFLRERLAQPFIQDGKDFSQPIYRLAKEFKQVINSFDSPHDFKGSVKELVSVLEQCADAVKVELIVRTFQQSGDARSLAKVKSRLPGGKEVRERVLEPLKKRLTGLGLGEDEFDEIFAAGERRGARKSSAAAVSPEDVEELRRVRDRLEEEVRVLLGELRRTTAQRERVENIIQSIAEGLVVLDNEGKIQMLNPAAEKLLGIKEGQAIGVPMSQSLKTEHIVALTKGPLLDEGPEVGKEIEVRSIDDETRKILQASSAVLQNEQGRTVGVVAVLSDITKQKKLDEMKSQFVAHVSHELRTPLAAIEQSLAILQAKDTGEITPAQEHFLSIAQRNISRLSRLVNDLLYVAKLEAGQMKLNVIPFKICDMVHHVAETVRALAESNGVAIEEKFPETDVEVEADADRLIQVITNLTGNAIKFTPSGGKITVEIDPDLRDQGVSEKSCISISVQDTGVGIPREDQEKIFRKFEQGSAPSPGGQMSSTGLGLSIAKEIVELHGGKIWVESREGGGSRFVFVIPRRYQDRVTPVQPPAP